LPEHEDESEDPEYSQNEDYEEEEFD